MQVYVHLRERNVQPDFGEALVYFFVHVEKDAPEIVGAGPYAYDDVNRTVAEARQRDEMGRFGKYCRSRRRNRCRTSTPRAAGSPSNSC